MFDGDVIIIRGYKRRWVVLKVTRWDVENTNIKADEPGFYAFGGMWYGDNPLSKSSYGRILSLKGKDKIALGTVNELPLETLKKLVN